MQANDETALEALYRRYAGLVFTLALRIVGHTELACDVLQGRVLRWWDGRETYDPGRGRIAWWLMGITRNRAIDVLRSRSHQARLREREPLSSAPPIGVFSDSADTIALRRAVTSALEGLPDGQRQAIELAYYRGLTQAEIAHELREPLGTVKSRTRDAMERLRASLSPLLVQKEKGV